MACPLWDSNKHTIISLELEDEETPKGRKQLRTQEALSPLGLEVALRILSENATRQQLAQLKESVTPWSEQARVILQGFKGRSKVKQFEPVSEGSGKVNLPVSQIEKALAVELGRQPSRSSSPGRRSRNGFSPENAKAVGVVVMLALTAAVFASAGGGGGAPGGQGFFVNFSQRFVRPRPRKLTPVESVEEFLKKPGLSVSTFNPNWPGGLP